MKTNRNIQWFLALACLLVLCLALWGPALAEEVGGNCGAEGDNVTWSYDTETFAMTISGTGAMADYTEATLANRGWNPYIGQIKSVTIGSGVTHVGNWALNYADGLETLALSNGLQSIGDSAFNTCSSLTSLSIPASVETIGEYSFYQCMSCTSLTFEEKEDRVALSIGEYAFYCIGNPNIAFSDANKFSLVLPFGLTACASNAFSYANISSLFIPKSLKAITEYAFCSCKALATITFEDASVITGIGEAAFCEFGDGCVAEDDRYVYNQTGDNYALGALRSKTGNTEGSNQSFIDCLPEFIGYCGASGHEQEVRWTITRNEGESTYALSIEYVGSGEGAAMADYASDTLANRGWHSYIGQITSVTIGSGVTKVGDYAFYTANNDTNQIASLVFENTQTKPCKLQTLGEFCFTYSHITSLEIPSSVTSIGNRSFKCCYDCASLTFDNEEGSQPLTMGVFAFYYLGKNCSEAISLKLPSRKVNWETTFNWTYYYDSNGAFDSANISSLYIPEEITQIPSDAFELCAALTQITFEDASKIEANGIKEYAFCDISSSVQVVNETGNELDLGLLRSKTESGNSKFVNALPLCGCCGASGHEQELIWRMALNEDGSTYTLTISYEGSGEGAAMADYSKGGCPWNSYLTKITKVIIGSGVTRVGEKAFLCYQSYIWKVTAITSVEFEEPCKVVSLGYECFYKSSLTSLVIPSSVETIEERAFMYSSQLETLTLGDHVKTIGLYAFSETPITSLVIPASVETIAKNAFYNTTKCASLSFETPETTGTTLTIDVGAFDTMGSASSSFHLEYPARAVKFPETTVSMTLSGQGRNTSQYVKGSFAFKGLNITSVTIPKEVTTIPTGTFYGCSKLAKIVFEDISTISEIQAFAFDGIAEGVQVLVGAEEKKGYTLPLYAKTCTYYEFTTGTQVYGHATNTTFGKALLGNWIGEAGHESEVTWSLDGNKLSINYTGTDANGVGMADFGTKVSYHYPFGTGEFGRDNAKYDLPVTPWLYSLDNITTVSIGVGVTHVGDFAFNGCSKLTELQFEGTEDHPCMVKSLGTDSFRGTALTSLTTPSSLEEIGMMTFYQVPLQTLTLNEGLKTIGDGAFEDLPITSLTIPASVEIIHGTAFRNCKSCASLTFKSEDNSPLTLMSESFAYLGENCDTVSVVIRNFESPGIYNQNPFSNANISSVFIPKNVKVILGFFFSSSTNLTKITFEDASCIEADGIKANAFHASVEKVTVSNQTGDLYALYDLRDKTNSEGNDNFINALPISGFCGEEGHVEEVSWLLAPNGWDENGNRLYPIMHIAYKGTGEGAAMADYTTDTLANRGWHSYIGQITSVTIGSGVTKVGDYALYTAENDTNQIASLVFENTQDKPCKVQTLGKYCFPYSHITSLEIPASVVTIDNYAFNTSKYLTNLTLGEHVKTIGNDAFSSSGITSLEIPASVETIGDNAFGLNSNCTSLTFKDEEGSPSLKLGAFAFKSLGGESGKTFDLVLPSRQIDWAFDANNTNGAFQEAVIGSVYIPKEVTLLPSHLFIDDDYLTKITFEDASAITEIQKYAFSGICRQDPTALVVENLTGTGVQNILDLAFLKDKTDNTDSENQIFIDALPEFGYCGAEGDGKNVYYLPYNGTLYVIGTGAMKDYANAYTLAPWSEYADQITKLEFGKDITNLGNYSFYNCNMLAEVTFEAGSQCAVIGEGAFENCTALKKVELPESVKTIKYYAFDQSGLTSMELPASVETLETSIFTDCNSLTEITIPEGSKLSSINEDAFSKDGFDVYHQVKSYSPASIFNTTSGGSLLKACYYFSVGEKLWAYYAENTLYITGDEGFTGDCTVVDAAKMFNTANVTIQNVTMKNLESLKSVTIGTGCFQGMSGFDKIIFAENTVKVGKDAFAGCTGIEHVEYSPIKTASVKSEFVAGNAKWTAIDIEDGNDAILIPQKLYTEYEKDLYVGAVPAHNRKEFSIEVYPTNALDKSCTVKVDDSSTDTLAIDQESDKNYANAVSAENDNPGIKYYVRAISAENKTPGIIVYANAAMEDTIEDPDFTAQSVALTGVELTVDWHSAKREGVKLWDGQVTAEPQPANANISKVECTCDKADCSEWSYDTAGEKQVYTIKFYDTDTESTSFEYRDTAGTQCENTTTVENVEYVPVTGIEITKPASTDVELIKDVSTEEYSGTLQITAAVEPENATYSALVYTITEGGAYATVDSTGKVTFTKTGEVTVKVSANDPYLETPVDDTITLKGWVQLPDLKITKEGVETTPAEAWIKKYGDEAEAFWVVVDEDSVPASVISRYELDWTVAGPNAEIIETKENNSGVKIQLNTKGDYTVTADPGHGGTPSTVNIVGKQQATGVKYTCSPSQRVVFESEPITIIVKYELLPTDCDDDVVPACEVTPQGANVNYEYLDGEIKVTFNERAKAECSIKASHSDELDKITISSGDYVPVTEFAITTEQTSIIWDFLGENCIYLHTSVEPEEATYTSVEYISSNESVATVNQDGKVTFLMPGTVTITAKVTDVYGVENKNSINLYCYEELPEGALTGIQLSAKQTVVYLKKNTAKVRVNVTYEPADALYTEVKFTSSNEKIATVNEKGLVTFHKAGKVKITATSTYDEDVCAQITLRSVNAADKITNFAVKNMKNNKKVPLVSSEKAAVKKTSIKLRHGKTLHLKVVDVKPATEERKPIAYEIDTTMLSGKVKVIDGEQHLYLTAKFKARGTTVVKLYPENNPKLVRYFTIKVN